MNTKADRVRAVGRRHRRGPDRPHGGPRAGGGVVADRFGRRGVMTACDLARLVLMLGLALVAATHLPVLAPVLAALATAAGTPYLPCVSAVTPRLVRGADQDRQLTLRTATMSPRPPGLPATAAAARTGIAALQRHGASPWHRRDRGPGQRGGRTARCPAADRSRRGDRFTRPRSG